MTDREFRARAALLLIHADADNMPDAGQDLERFVARAMVKADAIAAARRTVLDAEARENELSVAKALARGLEASKTPGDFRTACRAIQGRVGDLSAEDLEMLRALRARIEERNGWGKPAKEAE
jgi:hypothetical protein